MFKLLYKLSHWTTELSIFSVYGVGAGREKIGCAGMWWRQCNRWDLLSVYWTQLSSLQIFNFLCANNEAVSNGKVLVQHNVKSLVEHYEGAAILHTAQPSLSAPLRCGFTPYHVIQEPCRCRGLTKLGTWGLCIINQRGTLDVFLLHPLLSSHV